MIGAYVLSREIDESNGDYTFAFDKYEKTMRNLVKASQDLAENNQHAFTQSSICMKIQFYLMRILPKRIVQYFNENGKKQMKEVANSLTLEPATQLQK